MNALELLTAMTEHICVGGCLTFSNLDKKLIDDLLAARDDLDFDHAWVKAYTSTKEGVAEIGYIELKAIHALSEAAYKSAFRFADTPEFAGYVSDDLELIGRCLALSIDNPWVNGLWISYKAGCFPAGFVESHRGPLDSLFV